jgi:hypothetical protein
MHLLSVAGVVAAVFVWVVPVSAAPAWQVRESEWRAPASAAPISAVQGSGFEDRESIAVL